LTFVENQQVRDLTSNPDSPKCKRQKTMSETQEILINDDIDEIDENDVIITYIKNLPSKPCVMFCGFSTQDKEILKMVFCHLFFLNYII